MCTVSCGSESESGWCSWPDLPEDSLWTLELEQLPPLNLWDSYITSDPLGPTQGRTKGIGLSVEVLCSKFVPVFFEEFSFSLGHRCRRVGNSYCYRRGFCWRHRALLFFFF